MESLTMASFIEKNCRPDVVDYLLKMNKMIKLWDNYWVKRSPSAMYKKIGVLKEYFGYIYDVYRVKNDDAYLHLLRLYQVYIIFSSINSKHLSSILKPFPLDFNEPEHLQKDVILKDGIDAYEHMAEMFDVQKFKETSFFKEDLLDVAKTTLKRMDEIL